MHKVWGEMGLLFKKATGAFRTATKQAGGSGLQGKVPFGLNRTTGKVPFFPRKGFFGTFLQKESLFGFHFALEPFLVFLAKRNLSLASVRNLSLGKKERFLCFSYPMPNRRGKVPCNKRNVSCTVLEI